MTERSDRSLRTEQDLVTQRRTGAVARANARATRAEAAALRAESRQARRQADAVIEARNAILEAAVEITQEILARGRYVAMQPVTANFTTNEHGSTGVEITVRLEDATDAAAAKRAIVEHFGETSVDTVSVT